MTRLHRKRGVQKRLWIHGPDNQTPYAIPADADLRIVLSRRGAVLAEIGTTASTAGSVIEIGATEQTRNGVTYPARAWAEVWIAGADLDHASGQVQVEASISRRTDEWEVLLDLTVWLRPTGNAPPEP